MSDRIANQKPNHITPAQALPSNHRRDKRVYWLGVLCIYTSLVFPLTAMWLLESLKMDYFEIISVAGSLIGIVIIFQGGLLRKSFRENIVAKYIFFILALFPAFSVLLYFVKQIDSL